MHRKIWKEAGELEKTLVKVGRHTRKVGKKTVQVSGYWRKR